MVKKNIKKKTIYIFKIQERNPAFYLFSKNKK